MQTPSSPDRCGDLGDLLLWIHRALASFWQRAARALLQLFSGTRRRACVHTAGRHLRLEPGVTPVLAASRRCTRAHRTLAPRLPDVSSQPSLAERLDSLRPYEPVSRVSPAVSRLLWTAIRCQRGLLCPLGEGRVSAISRAFECRCGGSGEPPGFFNGLAG